MYLYFHFLVKFFLTIYTMYVFLFSLMVYFFKNSFLNPGLVTSTFSTVIILSFHNVISISSNQYDAYPFNEFATISSFLLSLHLFIFPIRLNCFKNS